MLEGMSTPHSDAHGPRDYDPAGEVVDLCRDLIRIDTSNYGEAEGLTGIELDARFPEGVDVPGREAREAVAERVIAGLHRLADAHPGEAIIVVAHGGVIRSVLETVAPGRHREPITNGSVHSFQHADGGLELVLFNDPLDEQSIFPYADDYDEQNPLAHREGEREEG